MKTADRRLPTSAPKSSTRPTLPAPLTSMSPLTIAEVAERTGTSVHTLRYYERIGLIRPVSRARSGHRRYAPEDVQLIEFLRKIRATGMPIRRMLVYAELMRRGEPTFGERRALLEEHRVDVARKLAELTQHLDMIDRKVRMYSEREREVRKTKAH
jgi:DNA-binding transcriptional MerR regulator